LFAVIILLAVMTAAVALALDDAVESIQAAGGIRAKEMIRSGMNVGLDQAIERVKGEDVSVLSSPPPEWDIFQGGIIDGNPNEFMPPMDYPVAGPYQNQFRVRFGLRPGQRTRAPAGEDVTKAYGQIVEVQIGIAANYTNASVGIPPAEDRVSVGILIPRVESHAN
jgi:hypothetical protein